MGTGAAGVQCPAKSCRKHTRCLLTLCVCVCVCYTLFVCVLCVTHINALSLCCVGMGVGAGVGVGVGVDVDVDVDVDGCGCCVTNMALEYKGCTPRVALFMPSLMQQWNSRRYACMYASL
jgi:hypothetical protein